MFNIFNVDDSRYGNKIPFYPNPNLNNILFREKIRFFNYINNENFFINNKHPLVALLSQCYIDKYLDMVPEEIAYLVKDTSLSLGNTMGYVTDRSKGILFKEGKLRYLIYLENDININSSNDYEIIKCLYTDYRVLDFSYNTEQDEFLILRVNIIELILSYVEWKRKRLEEQKTINFAVYIVTYILPKIWDTKYMHVMFNRFMDTWYRKKLPTYKNKHAIQLYPREDLIDSENRRMVKYLRKHKKARVYDILQGYIWLGKDLLEILSFDKQIFLHHTTYLLFLARYQHVLFFLDVIRENKSKSFNIEHLNELIVTFRRITSGIANKIPELPKDILDNYLNGLDSIKKEIGFI